MLAPRASVGRIVLVEREGGGSTGTVCAKAGGASSRIGVRSARKREELIVDLSYLKRFNPWKFNAWRKVCQTPAPRPTGARDERLRCSAQNLAQYDKKNSLRGDHGKQR